MKKIMFVQQLVIFLVVASLLAGYGCVQSDYEYKYLLPPGWEYAIALAINDNGVVAGYGSDGTTTMGFVYANGEYIKVLPSGWRSAYLTDINNKGVVVGFGNDYITDKCFIYDNGEYTELLPPGWESAGQFADYQGINDSGVVVGGGSGGIFMYMDGAYTEVLSPGLEGAEVRDINNNGIIVGFTRPEGTRFMGFIYDNGECALLQPPGWYDALLYAINDNGTVVGGGSGGSFIYQNGEYTELPDEMPEPSDINNNAVVVGYSSFGGLGSWKHQSFVYKDGEVTELRPPGYRYSVAEGISNDGVVVGYVVNVMKGRAWGLKGFIATQITP